MQSPSPSTENSHECDRALEFYSAMRDGELGPEDQVEWLRLQEKYSAEIAVFASAWGEVEPALRRIPAESVGDILVSRIAAELNPVRSLRQGGSRRGWAHQLTAAASLLALGLMVVVLGRTGIPGAATDGGVNQSRAYESGDSWRVVVLAAKESDREAVLGRLQSFVGTRENRLSVGDASNSVAGEKPAERIVLEGDIATSASFVSELEDAQLVESPAWDPMTVGEMSRQDLIEAVRKSQQTPTLSERHFGLIVVDFPRPAETLVADNRSEVDQSETRMGNIESVKVARNSAVIRETDKARFCVVILEFSKTADESAGDATRNLL